MAGSSIKIHIKEGYIPFNRNKHNEYQKKTIISMFLLVFVSCVVISGAALLSTKNILKESAYRSLSETALESGKVVAEYVNSRIAFLEGTVGRSQCPTTEVAGL